MQITVEMQLSTPVKMAIIFLIKRKKKQKVRSAGKDTDKLGSLFTAGQTIKLVQQLSIWRLKQFGAQNKHSNNLTVL